VFSADKKGIPRNWDAFRFLTSCSSAARLLAASPAFSFRLPAFSVPASVSVADAEAVARALPLPEEACVRAGARLVEQFAGAERARDEQLRDGCSARPQAGDSLPDGSSPGGCLGAALKADDHSSRGAGSDGSFRERAVVASADLAARRDDSAVEDSPGAGWGWN